jgi:hypothetical protein
MSQQQGQTQDQQTQLQNEYPASADSGYSETQGPANGDDTQVEQRDDSWRPSEDPAIEQAGGITQSTEEEPGRSQQDGKAQGEEGDTSRTHGQGAGNSGL